MSVLVGHDRRMKTKTHDVILQARELGRRLEAARGEPIDWSGPATDTADVEAAIAELQWSKGDYSDVLIYAARKHVRGNVVARLIDDAATQCVGSVILLSASTRSRLCCLSSDLR
jgi:hypothetical protein